MPIDVGSVKVVDAVAGKLIDVKEELHRLESRLRRAGLMEQSERLGKLAGMVLAEMQCLDGEVRAVHPVRKSVLLKSIL